VRLPPKICLDAVADIVVANLKLLVHQCDRAAANDAKGKMRVPGTPPGKPLIFRGTWG